MDRGEALSRALEKSPPWDLLVVGGGATGLGIAVDASARGYRTLLLEAGDFAGGTSSRSTKLVHGGVRYLRQGHIPLVLEALRERDILRRNAPHLVRDLPFVVPAYKWWERPFYGVGLKLYDALADRHSFGRSQMLTRAQTLEYIPTLRRKNLCGSVLYHDGQFDDARLALCLARTAWKSGAALLNYAPVVALERSGETLKGAVFRDLEGGKEYAIEARALINAAGPLGDAVRRLDDPRAAPLLRPSQGVHIVLERSFLPGQAALMVPHTDDGRVLFAIPWQGRLVVGTTDTPVARARAEPRPLPGEIDFLLEHVGRYLCGRPTRADVLSAFAGLRPLVGEGERTAALSRDHLVHLSPSGLLTVAGGKWTTYRRMAEDAVDQAAGLAGLPPRPSPTRDWPLHGHRPLGEPFGELAAYGAEAPQVQSLIDADPALAEKLHPRLPFCAGQILWAARFEMARTVEDALARRTRALLLDARASAEAAPAAAAILAGELGRDEGWQKEQVRAFSELAAGYLPD